LAQSENYKYIKDTPDYSHLSDRSRYKQLYEEVGTIPANQSVVWRQEWMKHFHPNPNSTILELGAHNGPNLIHYARQGHIVHGVEISETLISTFYRALKTEPESVKARVRMFSGWIEEFIPEMKYDYVLCTEILEHVPDPILILQTARRSVKEKGFIYISSPTKHWGNNTHVRGVPAADLKQWLKHAGLTPARCWEEDEHTFCIAVPCTKTKVFGLTRIRNESQIIIDTLNHMATFCNGGIVVYDDCSTDQTVALCRSHPAVLEVIQGETWDNNRENAEFQNRAILLEAGKKYATNSDWFVYLDADERVEYTWEDIYFLPDDILAVRMKLFDYYITFEDKHKPYWERKWLGPEYRQIIIAFRNLPTLSYHHPDQREVTLGQEGKIISAGHVKHYGKAISVNQWEQTCDYYSRHFPKYAAKWAARKGRAIHDKSDFGNPLIRWEERDSKGFPLTEELMQQESRELLMVSDSQNNQPTKRILIGLNKLNDFTGSETYTVTLGKWLEKQGYEIHIYAHYGYGGEIYNDTSFVFWDKDTIDFNQFRYYAIIVQQKAATEILAQKFPFTPLISIHHGIIEDEKPLDDIFYDYAICVSEEVKQHFKTELNSTPVRVIPNFIDLERYPYKSRKQPNNKILWAGGIHPWRIHSLEFAIEIARRIPEVELDIIGQTQMAWQKPIEKNIHYLGTLPISAEVLKNYSLVIGVGRIALEAVAVGTPVLIAGKDGVDGFLVPEKYEFLQKANFSGRVNPGIYCEAVYNHFACEIKDLLQKNHWWLQIHQSYKDLRKRFASDEIVPKILDTIEMSITNKQYLNVLAITYNNGAVTQVRIISPFKELFHQRKIKYRLITINNAKKITHHDLWDVDILVFQRIDFAPLLKVLRFAKNQGITTVYEIDDNLLEIPPYNPGYSHYSRPEIRKTIIQFIREVDFVTVTTQPLKEYFSENNSKIVVLPNQIDTEVFQYQSNNLGKGIRIGYAGTITHQGDFAQVIPALKCLKAEYRDKIRLVFINFVPEEFRGDPDIEFIPGTDYLPKFAKIFAEANLDIGLAPLKFNEFNRAKSDVKFLEYGIQKIAGIYSAFDPYLGVVQDGVTGLLVASENPQLWYEKIKFLLDNPDEIQKIKENAYRYVLNCRSFKSQAINWFNIYQSFVAKSEVKAAPAIHNIKKEVKPDSGIVSIIVLTWNAFQYTRKCIESIIKYTNYPYELIIVDNGSTDGTVEYIKSLTTQYAHVRLVENSSNVGFAAGNNQGAKFARGKYLLFLNNDVLVSDGWLHGLVAAIESDERIGAAGPMTNRISGRQSYSCIPYYESDEKGFHKFAQHVSQVKSNVITPRRRLAGFALIIYKRLFEEIGGFDVSFGTGNFEDDDLSLRIRKKGYLLMVNEGVYIHHFGSQTFKVNRIDYKKSIQERLAIFQKKWPEIDYQMLLEIKSNLVAELEAIKKNAFRFMQTGRLEEAIKEFQKIVKENPLDYAAVLNLAELQHKIKRSDLALITIKSLLKRQPPLAEALNLAGIIAFEVGNKKNAVDFFRKALYQRPAEPEFRKNLAESLIALGNYEEGLQQYQHVIAHYPQDIETLIRLGQLFLERDDHDQAYQYFIKAYQIDPKNPHIAFLGQVINQRESQYYTPVNQSRSESGNSFAINNTLDKSPEFNPEKNLAQDAEISQKG